MAKRKRKGVNQIAEGLFSKLITGQGTPGEGVIPFAQLPKQIREGMPQLDQPPIGFDPAQLDRREMMLLRRLLARGQQEAQGFEQGR
jgi:hypothetical protein